MMVMVSSVCRLRSAQGRGFFKDKCSTLPLRKRMPIEKSGHLFSDRTVISSIRTRIMRFFSTGVEEGAFQISGILRARSRMSFSSSSEGTQFFLNGMQRNPALLFPDP